MGKMKIIKAICILLILLFSHNAFAQMPRRSETISWEQIRRLSNEDHKRMMKLLGIKSIRPGRNGMNPKADNYANHDEAKAMFMAAVGAGSVYKLLGKKDMGTTEFPPIETTLIDGEVAFRQHSGGHSPGPNWPTLPTFAQRYLNKN